MTAKPSYEELERRVQELEIIESDYKHLIEVSQENDSLFKRLFDKAPLGYQSLDENGHFLVVNTTWLDTLGYTKEEVIGKSFSDFLHPDWRNHFKENFPRLKSVGEVLGVEFEMVKKNGDLILVSFTGKISRDKKGHFQQTHCIFHDITERKQADEALRQSERRFKLMFRNHSAVMLLIEPESGVIIDANLAAEKFYGYSHEELLSMNICHINTLTPQLIASARQAAREEKRNHFIFPHRLSDGEIRTVEVHSTPIMVDNSTQLFSIIHDITKAKQAEDALRESDLKYSKLFQSKVSGLAFCEVVLDEQGRLVDYRFLEVNDAFSEMTGLQKEMVEGRTAREAIPGIEKSTFDYINAHGNVALTGEETTFEAYQEYLERWYLVHVYSPKKGFFVSIFSDITDRKRFEEQIKKSLAEKEVLLKEIHHRVKNNLQIISSLVSMQADNLTDERTREEFDDVCDRVRTMGLIHEKLYQTDDLALLNFSDYSTSLLQYLWSSHDVLAEKVMLNLALVPLELTIETAVPCGLILNELAGNALKHAFPNGRDGIVTVGLEHDTATKTACLWVRDNGVGLATDLDWRKSSSLGLRLVQILVGQLRGTVETGTGPGAEFRVTFPLKGLQS